MRWSGRGGDGCDGMVTSMETVSGDGLEMVRCGVSSRLEWSSGVWRGLWVRRSSARIAGYGVCSKQDTLY
nr:hypothetical protein [Tanacetum cinerariifolium]